MNLATYFVFFCFPATVFTWSGILLNYGQTTQIWTPTGSETVNFGLPKPADQFSIVLDGKVHIFNGGFDSPDSYVVFDPKTNKTSPGAPLDYPYGGNGVLLAVINVPGGGEGILACGNKGDFDHCKKLVNGQWFDAANPRPNDEIVSDPSKASMASVNGVAYLVGGHDTFQQTGSDTLKYDASADKWETMAVAPARIVGETAIGLNSNTLMIVGGAVNSIHGIQPNGNTVYLYNTQSNTWSTGSPLVTARGNPRLTSYQGRIYCFGGWNADITGVVQSIEVLDTSSMTWHTLPQTINNDDADAFSAVAVN